MNEVPIKVNPEVEQVFSHYPPMVRRKLLQLRRLIVETANETEGVHEMEETLKWGEPSYLVKKGSTIRIDWKKKKPDQYAMYFKCTSQLVPTFKAIYPKLFKYEGNRAIIFTMEDTIPEAALKNCISVGLTYHSVKHLPLLGL